MHRKAFQTQTNQQVNYKLGKGNSKVVCLQDSYTIRVIFHIPFWL